MPVPIDFIVENLKSQTNKHHPKLKFPCGACVKNVNYNNPSILCISCTHWIHIKCTDTTIEGYNDMMERNKSNPDLIENEPWIGPKCSMIENIQISPYELLNDADIININSSSSMRVLDMIAEFEIVSATSKINDISSSDIDGNLPRNINCKYYTQHSLNYQTKKLCKPISCKCKWT